MQFFILILIFPFFSIFSQESYLEANFGYWTGIYKQSIERQFFLDALIDNENSYNDKWSLSESGNTNLYPLNFGYYKKFMGGFLALQTNYYRKTFDNISYRSTINIENHRYNLIKNGSITDWSYLGGFKFGILTEKLVFFPSLGIRNYFKSFHHRFITYGKNQNLFSTGGKYTGQSSQTFYKIDVTIQAKKDVYLEISLSDTLRQKIFLNEMIKQKAKFAIQTIGKKQDDFFLKASNFSSAYQTYISRFSLGMAVAFSDYFYINFGGRLEQTKEMQPKYNSLTFSSKAPYLDTDEILSDKAIYQNEFISKKQGLYIGIKAKLNLSSSKQHNFLDNGKTPNRYKNLYKQYR